MTVTDQQARAVAFLLNQLRPDWGAGSLLTLIGKHPDIELGPLIIAATTKALEPTCATPAPVWAPGPHWPVKARAALPPPQRCPVHVSYPQHNCGGCRADKLAQPPEHEAATDVAASVIQGEK